MKKTLIILKLSLLALACVFILQTRASTTQGRRAHGLPCSVEDSSDAGPTQEIIKKGEQPQEGEPCPPKSKLAGMPNRPPTSDEYASLLQDLVREYGNRLAKTRPEIDRGLESAPQETDGPNLGALLAGMGAGSASVYVLAQSALKKPGDALTANNLGVALLGVNDYARACLVLLYADKLRPGVSLVILNLAWLFYDIGDSQNAKTYFERAEGLAPGLSGPKLGLGLIARCKGNHVLAASYLRQSLRIRFSPVGASALMESEQAAKDAGNTLTDSQPVAIGQETPCDYQLPELPIGRQPGGTDEDLEAVGNLTQKVGEELTQRVQAVNPLAQSSFGQAEPTVQRSARSVIYPRTYEKELFMLDDIYQIFLGDRGYLKRYGDGLNDWNEIAQSGIQAFGNQEMAYNQRMQALNQELLACGDNQACIDRVLQKEKEEEYQHCLQKKKYLADQYAAIYKLFKDNWDDYRQVVTDYVCFTDPILARIHRPDLNKFENNERRMNVLNPYLNILGWAQRALATGKAYSDLECIPPPPPTPQQIEDPSPQDKAGRCPEERHWGLSPGFDLTLSCESVKFEAGEGLMASVEYNRKKGETTVWVGGGAKFAVAEGPIPRAELEAKTGWSVTVDKNGYQDMALETDVNLKFGVGPGFSEHGIQSRIALEGGPSFVFK
jgi:tetratricopeptide (TPR) repeat protein